MTCLDSNHSYSHTRHFVDVPQFNNYIQGLLSSESKLDGEKKSLLEAIVKTETWMEIQQSSYWRHNIFNGGLSGPFTEYFACFNPQWKVDFWGQRVQPIDITYLNEHAIPRAYQSTVLKTQQTLSEKVKEWQVSGKKNIEIGSLACGTMYDVLGAVPMNWSANLRTDGQVRSLVEKGGWTSVSILEESHQIHPLIVVFKA